MSHIFFILAVLSVVVASTSALTTEINDTTRSSVSFRSSRVGVTPLIIPVDFFPDASTQTMMEDRSFIDSIVVLPKYIKKGGRNNFACCPDYPCCTCPKLYDGTDDPVLLTASSRSDGMTIMMKGRFPKTFGEKQIA
eukprot:CAMPEP_0170945296 /NCGR_PEP_ID=MMETSP0735-20130129/26359_1 /TAXON_ID=186038 /ORGANISM="Fragilariopsis kerguelensis, Strain L26-C5" /LENGTH=136 /DNA_ID=CAMNT_0011353669 /DNA_START=77 /DNA_END=487 /DNA_ORIENTATION=+